VDRRSFLERIARGGAGAAVLAAPGGYALGQFRGTRSVRNGLAPRVAASGARGHARVWWSAETEDRVVALTFDDGPLDRYTPELLEVLARHDAVATFFSIGALVDRRPDLLAEVAAAGHEIGNHTYHHHGAEELSREDVLESVERGADAVAAVIGHRPRWFRPVKGHVTGSVLRAAARVGHDVAIWSLSRGPKALPDGDAAGVEAHLRAKVHPGAIVMLHDGLGRSPLERFGPDGRLIARRDAEMAALPRVLEAWAEEGYRFVTLSELVDEHDETKALVGDQAAPEEEPVDVVATEPEADVIETADLEPADIDEGEVTALG